MPNAWRPSIQRGTIPIETCNFTVIAGCWPATPPDSSTPSLAAAFFGDYVGRKGCQCTRRNLARRIAKPRLFKNYSRRVNHVTDMYLTFVNSWYRSKEFVEVFLNPPDM